MTSQTFPVLRGDPLTIRLANLTLDGSPWADVADYDPVAQVRASERGPVVAEFTVTYDAGDLVFDLADTEPLDQSLYLFDVEFVDPATSRPFTWPPAGQPRHRLTVSSDITRREVAP